MLHHIPMRQKVLVMIAVMSGLFLVALDQTIISTALGKIVEEFNSFSSLGWVVTAYLLTSTVTVPLAGKLSDIFGRRQVLMVGVALFTLASLLSGSSQNIEQLIAYRALQGIGGGILMANAFTIIGDLFNPRERGKWQGLLGAVFGLASVVGPLLGGFLADPHTIAGLVTDWRWTFWINVPIGIVSFLIIARYTPQIKHDHKPKLDYAGAGFLTAALSSIVLAVDNTEKIFADLIAHSDITVGAIKLALYLFAALMIAGFIWAERRASEPIIPLSFFKNRTFTTVMIVALMFGAAFLGAILYLTQFNQQVFGADATTSGLMLLPMILALSGTAALIGQLVTKTGKYKLPLVIGFTLATIGVFSLSFLTPDSPYWIEAILMVFVGAGLGSGMPILNLAVQNEFTQRDLGAATASNQLFRSLGSTMGVAILGSMLTAGIVTHLGDLNQDAYIQTLKQSPASSQLLQTVDADTALNLNTHDTEQKINDGFAKGIEKLPASAQAAVKKDFETKQADYKKKVVNAFSDSLRPIFYLSAGLMLLATIGASVIREKPLRDGGDDAPGVVE
jgi:EmrB/QacA subfamily drug resistance transporter